MTATLELPNLGTVPRTWTMHRPSALAARTALALLDAGHLDDAHRPLTTEPAELVKAGLKAWLDGNARGLKLFEFRLIYAETHQRNPQTGVPTDGKQIQIGIGTGDFMHPLAIGRRICKLPRAIAETVLYWIRQAQYATLPIYTPGYALECAEYSYWHGESDETFALEQIVEDGGKPEEFELLKRADFDKAIPPWASMPKKRLDMKAIKALAGSRRAGPDVAVGRALFTLIGALAEYRRRINFGINTDEDPTIIFPPTLGLFWGGWKGLMPRIYDDYAEEVSNCGEYRQHFAATTIADGPKLDRELQAFMRGVEPVFPILRTLETLLTHITDHDLAKT